MLIGAPTSSAYDRKRRNVNKADAGYKSLPPLEPAKVKPSYLTPVIPPSYTANTVDYPRRQCKINGSLLAYYICSSIAILMALTQVYSSSLCYQNQIITAAANNTAIAKLEPMTCVNSHHNPGIHGLPTLDYLTFPADTNLTQNKEIPYSIHFDGGWPKANSTFHIIAFILSTWIGIWIACRDPSYRIRQGFWFATAFCWLIALILDFVALKYWGQHYCQGSSRKVLINLFTDAIQGGNTANGLTIAETLETANPLLGGCKLRSYETLAFFIILSFTASIVNFIVAILELRLLNIKDAPEGHYTMFVDIPEGQRPPEYVGRQTVEV